MERVPSSKSRLLLLLLVVAVTATATGAVLQDQQHTKEPTLELQWREFKAVHGKQYTSTAEEEYRRRVFMGNLQFIEKHNDLQSRGLTSFRMGVNHYTDMEDDEFSSVMLGLQYQPPSSPGSPVPSAPHLPDSVDWRAQGYVTPVKNQGRCGSCWAFSTTGALEGAHYRSAGRLVSLSEQNLMECSWQYGNKGCMGGNMTGAYKYIIDNGGIDTEKSYPYTGMRDPCYYSNKTIGATMRDYKMIPSGNESQLQAALALQGPISVAIDASGPFRHYQSGVYDNRGCFQHYLSHAVLAVGYGAQNGSDYWLVKNSWGASWGQAGYIKMSRNKNNQCGIATFASFPIV